MTAPVSDRIPVLDIGPYLAGEPGARARLGRDIAKTAADTGFLVIVNHGIPQHLIDGCFAAASTFFDRPEAFKVALKVGDLNIGYLPYGAQIVRTSKINVNTKPNLSESFYIVNDLAEDDPRILAGDPLYGLNRWPTDMPAFKAATLAYIAAMAPLADKMVSAVATALDLPPDYFDAMFEKPNTIQRLSHYPPRASYDDNEFSIAPHTDSGFMTLLAPSAVPGLAIRLPDGTWFDAPSIPGCFTVNGGDILRRWTNDRFLSTPYRALNVSGRERYAIPFFFDTHPDTLVTCLPSCQSGGNPPKYEPTTFHDYAVWYATRNYVHQDKESQG